MRREEGLRIPLVHSITRPDERCRSPVLVAGSHGGIYPGISRPRRVCVGHSA